MAEVLLFHHALGLTAGVLDFAASLRRAGHTVHAPDLYEGKTFETVDQGVAHARELTFDTVLQRAARVATGLPGNLVYAGFSLGALPVAQLATARPGAKGALFLSGFVPPSEFGSWPGLPAQVHGMDRDPEFADSGDLAAAREFAAQNDDVEVFVYPGSAHLFADAGLADHDGPAAALLTGRVLEFLSKI